MTTPTISTSGLWNSWAWIRHICKWRWQCRADRILSYAEKTSSGSTVLNTSSRGNNQSVVTHPYVRKKENQQCNLQRVAACRLGRTNIASVLETLNDEMILLLEPNQCSGCSMSIVNSYDCTIWRLYVYWIVVEKMDLQCKQVREWQLFTISSIPIWARTAVNTLWTVRLKCCLPWQCSVEISWSSSVDMQFCHVSCLYYDFMSVP